MTLGQMITLLRRRLQEKTATNWQDADLTDLLNLGLHRVQMVLKRVHPDNAIHRSIADITASNDLYDFPPGFVSEYLVELKQTDGTYKMIRRLNFRDTVDRTQGDDVRYARTGKWLRISPMPSAALAAGLRIWFVPTLTMSATTDVPDIPLVFHDGPVIAANRLGLGETGQASKDLTQEWAEFIQLVYDTYDVTNGDPQYLSVDMDKSVF